MSHLLNAISNCFQLFLGIVAGCLFCFMVIGLISIAIRLVLLLIKFTFTGSNEESDLESDSDSDPDPDPDLDLDFSIVPIALICFVVGLVLLLNK